MIGGKTVLGVIPARGGSKGVPRKNVRSFRGRPLLAWTIDAGNRSSFIDRLILSTDDEEIAAVGAAYGCDVPFRRPAELACDDTPSVDVLLDAVARFPGYHYAVLLQPTSPLREARDIDDALARCDSSGAPLCVSVTPVRKSPFWMYRITDDGRLDPILRPKSPILRRQDAPPVFMLNGAVYVARTDWITHHRTLIHDDAIGYAMPADRSLDIDIATDFMRQGTKR